MRAAFSWNIQLVQISISQDAAQPSYSNIAGFAKFVTLLSIFHNNIGEIIFDAQSGEQINLRLWKVRTQSNEKLEVDSSQ